METYEEKYKDLVKRLNKAREEKGVYTFNSVLDAVAPELKIEESEDERIRKAIIALLNTTIKGKKLYSITDTTRSEMLAWLEKQSEQKQVVIPKFRVGDIIRWKKAGSIEYTIKEICDKGYINTADGIMDISQTDIEFELVEQKLANLKTKAGNWYICDEEVMNENMVAAFRPGEIYFCSKDGYLDVGGALFEVGYLDVFRLATEKEISQSRQEWSEEDKLMRGRTINFIEQAKMYVDAERMPKLWADDCINWLKALKDRVQPQPMQEWNEKDEETLNLIIARLHSHPNVDLEEYSKECDWLKNKLKSIRPQSTWKPSEEQLIALKCAITTADEKWVCMNTKDLESLYEQLKKLREE